MDLGWAPPPPPPAGHVSLSGADSGIADAAATRERVQALVGHGAAAAGALASGGAAIAKEAARSFQGAAGVTAEQVEVLGLAAGLALGVGCLCCLRCACRRPTRPGLSRGQRARRALAGMATSSRGRGSRAHRALPVEDYDDDLDAPFDDEDEYVDEEDFAYANGGYDGYATVARERGRR